MNELTYLKNLGFFGIKLGLTNIKKFDKLLSHSHKNYKIIHIAGTNGKGSTANFTANILQKAGYKVGLYTSPHLVRFNERIKINGKEITTKELKEKIKKLRKIVEKNKLETTFFEFTTMLALDYFNDKKVDFVVLEVGLGGRFDATNIVNPKICAITNISKDHTQILGNTFDSIAFEKAGIIKRRKIVLTCETKKECLKVFRKKCKEMNSKLLQIKKFEKLKLSVSGNHQLKNANLAKRIIEELNLGINENIINQAIFETKVRGRLEEISKNPKIIIDAAHNPAGIKTTEKFISSQKNKKILLVGLSKDKPTNMIKNLANEFDEIVVSKSDFKPKEVEEILCELWQYNSNILGFDNIKEAKKYCISKLRKSDFMLVTGSIYFIGNYLKLK